MRKTILLMLVLLATCVSVSRAQTSKFNVTFATDLGLGGKSYKIVTPHISATYDITKRLSAGLRVEEAVTLMKSQGIKTYDLLTTFGGQVGYDIGKISIASGNVFSLLVQPRVSVGHTIGGGHNRGYMYYQGGIYVRKSSGSIRSELGLGVRYNDYRSDLNKDKAVFYVSYGFVLK